MDSRPGAASSVCCDHMVCSARNATLMRLFCVFSAFVLLMFVVYTAYAIPFLNEGKADELWGEQNKWAWYAQFCAFHFAYALLPISIAGVITFVLKRMAK